MLELASAEAAAPLLARYDRTRADTAFPWEFPRTGEFWEAVTEAHRRGLRGQGRRIAVIDSAFDLGYPALARASGGQRRMAAPAGEPAAHGTAVALLIATVAPEATLDLYEITRNGRPDLHAVRAALQRAAGSGAHAICLSLGQKVPREDVAITPDLTLAGGDLAGMARLALQADGAKSLTVRTCPTSPCLCAAGEAASVAGPMVFAAVGNDAGALFCPAMAGRVVAVGFQDDARVLQGGAETALGTGPSFSQAMWKDISLKQPPGVEGSSFAAPLAAGAAALGLDAGELPAFLASVNLAGPGDVLLALAQLGQGAPGQTQLMLETYQAALRRHPHGEALLDGEHWCIGCALFSLNLVINAGLALLGTGQPDAAEPLLRAGKRLAPRNPHARANLACTLFARAERGAPDARALLAEAATEYDAAIALRPGYHGYDATRAAIAARLAGG